MSLFAKPKHQVEKRLRLPVGYGGLMFGTPTPSGIYVDEDSAMRHPTVFSCVTKIAQDVSMMPPDVVRYVGSTRQVVNPTPQIVAAPSVTTDPMDWRYQVVASWLQAGNAWGLVTQTTRDLMWPTRIELLSPAQVRYQQHPGDRLRFFVDNVEHDLWPVGDLWHRAAYTMPGSSIGLSPLRYHADTIGTGLAAAKFGSEYFGNGGHPHALLQPATDPGQEGADRLKESFKRATEGRDLAVVPQSLKYIQIQTNPTDSQFLETQRFTAVQICQFFGEDPADHGAAVDGGSMTYANRTDADLARFKRRQFWVVKLQDALSSCLPRPQVVRLNTASTLMMTTRERYETHAIALQNKWRSINEVRELEDEEPIPGGDFGAAGDVTDDPQDPNDPEGGPT